MQIHCKNIYIAGGIYANALQEYLYSRWYLCICIARISVKQIVFMQSRQCLARVLNSHEQFTWLQVPKALISIAIISIKQNRTEQNFINPDKHGVPFLGHRQTCRPRSDATERGVWSGSTLFAHRNFYQNYDKNENSTLDTP